jgi:poly(A) polymerase Pap1
MLKEDANVSELHAVEDAFVPVIKLRLVVFNRIFSFTIKIAF